MDAIRSMPELYEVVGIAEPIAGRQTTAAGQRSYAGLKWLSEEELLADPSVIAIAVETTLDDSVGAALTCLRAGNLADAELHSQLASIPGHGMFELGCHLVDAALFLLGPPTAVSAFSKPTGQAPPGLPDNQVAVLEYPKAIVTLLINHLQSG
jgi:predicted dehydrogenase